MVMDRMSTVWREKVEAQSIHNENDSPRKDRRRIDSRIVVESKPRKQKTSGKEMNWDEMREHLFLPYSVMVHRPPDSRLLANLLAHEKDCQRHRSAALDASAACLASFSAFAAASAPHVSHVLHTAVSAFAAADDALRRYSLGVDRWRDQIRQLKDLEDDVANVMRDREILVTRLLKAANKKPDSSRAFPFPI